MADAQAKDEMGDLMEFGHNQTGDDLTGSTLAGRSAVGVSFAFSRNHQFKVLPHADLKFT